MIAALFLAGCFGTASACADHLLMNMAASDTLSYHLSMLDQFKLYLTSLAAMPGAAPRTIRSHQLDEDAREEMFRVCLLVMCF